VRIDFIFKRRQEGREWRKIEAREAANDKADKGMKGSTLSNAFSLFRLERNPRARVGKTEAEGRKSASAH